MIVSNAFTDIKLIEEERSVASVATSNEKLSTIEVGRGSKTMKVDERGLWLGAEDYADAPFRVSMEGVMYLSVGNGTITIDPTLPAIIINDGTNDRVILGTWE